MMDGTSYDVRLSSPLLGLFIEKENLLERNPPIHIDVSFDGVGARQEIKNVPAIQNMVAYAHADQESTVTCIKVPKFPANRILATFC
jgi:hypothetical protein